MNISDKKKKSAFHRTSGIAIFVVKNNEKNIMLLCGVHDAEALFTFVL